MADSSVDHQAARPESRLARWSPSQFAGDDAPHLFFAELVRNKRSGRGEGSPRCRADVDLRGHRVRHGPDPERTRLLKFRCLPTNRDLTEKFIEALSHHLENKGFTLGARTVVDATINHIMPTTKNESKALLFPASNAAYAARFCWWR